MNFSETVKEIRRRTGFSQLQLAESLNLSFATINRWENGHCQPSQAALGKLQQFCREQNINYSEFKDNSKKTGHGSIVLFHGSKSGISGPILPSSRRHCDFGCGFYMGTEPNQPLTLICNFPKARFYTLRLDLTELTIFDLEIGIDWALFIAYNRGKMEIIKGTSLYKKYQAMTENCDLIVGHIANDRMFVVLDRFFSGEITDLALINSLAALKLGKQYVAITQQACQQIEIIEDKPICSEERKQLLKINEANRKSGISIADEICHKYRRDGRFFDEILGDASNG